MALIEKCPRENRPRTMPRESLELMTRYVVHSMLGRPSNCPSEVANKLLRLVRKIEHDNGPFFAGVCNELNMSIDSSHSIFRQVADEIFAGQQNWGRVVSFCTFSVKVAEHFQRSGTEEVVDEVISWTTDYLNKLQWIEGRGGGWETFQHKFNPETTSTEQRSFWGAGLLVTATLGLGAIMAVTCKS